MLATPGNTRFIQSTVSPLGVDPYAELYSPGGLGGPTDSDYYPVANGPAQTNQTADEIRWTKCVDSLWKYEDLCFRPILSKIMAAWAQYNNLYDSDMEKDDWQSKKATPFMFITLERLAGAFVQFIEQKPGWFQGESSVPPMQLFVDLMTKFLGWWLSHPMVDFFSKFEEMIKSGIMTGHIHVTITVEQDGVQLMEGSTTDSSKGMGDFVDSLWKTLSPFLQNQGSAGEFSGLDSKEYPFIANPSMPRLCFTIIPTASVRLDSTGRERYKMWKTIMGVGEFIQTAGARGWNMQACYDSIGGHSMFFDQEMNNRAMQQGIARSQENPMHMVELLHFEGDLHDPTTGEPLFQKEYMVVANGRQIIYKGKMPFWDGQSIMVSAPFIKNPNAVYGKSFLPESVDMMDVRHDLMNVLLDYVRKVLQPPLQVDRSVLSDTALTDNNFTMYPNKVVWIRGNGAPNPQAITPVQTPDLPTGFWQFLQHFQQNQQEMTGMSQELMGAPRTRIRTTGMEQDAREAQAGKFLEAIWSGIERRLLQPLLRLACLRLLQYTEDGMWSAWVKGMKTNILPSGKPTTDPNVLAMWSSQLDKCAAWDAHTRFKYLGGFFVWKVSIFNNLSQRQAEIEKITMLLNVGSKIPGFFQSLKIPFWVEKLVTAFGWDPSECMVLDNLPAPNAEALDMLDPNSAFNAIMGGGMPGPMDNSGSGGQNGLGAFAAMLNAPPQPPLAAPAPPFGSTFPGGPISPSPGPITMPPGGGGAP